MRRPEATFGELVGAVSGVALLASLFFDWYGHELGAGDAAASGWESLTIIDIALALLGALAVAHWAARKTGRIDEARLPVAPAAVVAVAGGIALLLTVLRMVDLPDAATAANLDGLRVGTFLALLASAGIVVGSATALAERHQSWRPVGRERSGARSTPAPSPVIADGDRRPDEPHEEGRRRSELQ